METPWKRVQKTKSERQELEFSKLPGARKQVNSGRHWFSKGDNRLGVFLVDNKTTDAGSFTIDLNKWLQTQEQGMQTPPGLLGAWQINLQSAKLWLMRLDDWLAAESHLADMKLELDQVKMERDIAQGEVENLRRRLRQQRV